ncbi:hypothetical protein KJ966_31460 [bacterium]|nr:hypothetical protein [bacterium]
MIKLSVLIKLQISYFVAGLAYNIVSYLFLITYGQTLATTPPLNGVLSMLLYFALLIPAMLKHIRLYRILMAIAILVYGYGGIFVHIQNYLAGSTLYHSTLAWFLAIAINGFGLCLNLLAVSGKFVTDQE